MNSNAYSTDGINKRYKYLKSIGYFDDTFIIDLASNEQEVLKNAISTKNENIFKSWQSNAETKKEQQFIGTHAWLSLVKESLLEIEEKRPLTKKELSIGLTRNKFYFNFDKHLKIQRFCISKPLAAVSYLVRNTYNSFSQDTQSQHYVKRKEIIRSLGSCLYYAGVENNHWISIWVDSLQKARKINKRSVKLLENPKFYGSLFPTSYDYNLTTHPRFIYGNYQNVSTIQNTWRVCALQLFEQFSQVRVYSIDLSAAYIRYFYWVAECTKEISLAKNVMLNENFWDRLATYFLEQNGLTQTLNHSHVRSVFKVGCLALINGGGIFSDKNIKKKVENKYDNNNKPLASYLPMFVEFLSTLPIVQEIRKATRLLINYGTVYPFGNTKPYYCLEEKHKTLSAIYCGPEVLALTHLVQISLLPSLNLLPLALEYDGILIKIIK